MRLPTITLVLCAATCLFLSHGVQASSDTIKVFLMAGQSNMQGKGTIEQQVDGTEVAGTLRDYITQNPAEYGHLVDGANNFVTRDDVWVWSQQGSSGGSGGTLSNDAVRTGFLKPGFGSNANESLFGPELGFGKVVGDAYDEQVVLIKTAWGGASLHETFLSPSAVARRNLATGGSQTTGQAYTAMINSYQAALTDIAAQFPDQEIELVGMAWHQGWNDSLDADDIGQYEDNLVDFINDVRSDLGDAGLPFVIANTGMSKANLSGSRKAQLAALVAAQDGVVGDEGLAFDGNVALVDTRPFWREDDISPVDQIEHWNRNGESYYLIGESLGEEMLQVVPEPSSLGLLTVGGLCLLRRRRH